MSAELKASRQTLTVVENHGFTKRTDVELVLLCQKKDPAAFEELVKRHQRTVYGLLYNLAPEWIDTADLAQEAFIRIWRGIGSLHNPKAFRSWVTQIVTNLFYDELRKRPRRLPTVSLDQSYDADDESDNTTRDVRDTSAGPDELYHRNELTTAVQKAIEVLPEQFKTALTLREMDGLSYEEIANITQSDMGTVKSRIARARLKVQDLLKPYLKTDYVQKAA